MAQSFDPLKFLDLARELTNHHPDETQYRTAVNRTYYGLFLIARQKSGLTGRRAIHTNVIQAARRRKRSLGDQLDTLFRLRKVADYQLLPDRTSDRNWERNWRRAKTIAERILPELQAW